MFGIDQQEMFNICLYFMMSFTFLTFVAVIIFVFLWFCIDLFNLGCLFDCIQCMSWHALSVYVNHLKERKYR